MSLEDADTFELKDRYDFLIQKYVLLAKDLVPMLDKFGKYRQELQLISVEFQKRGVNVEDPQSLVELLEGEKNT